MLPQMKKDMSPFKERVQLLTEYREVFQRLSPEVAVSANRIIEETNNTLEIPAILNDVFYTLGNYQRQVKNKQGFLDNNLLQEVRRTFNQYRIISYEFGIRERLLVKHYEIVLDSLNDVSDEIPSNHRKKINNLLIAAKQSNQTTLEKSMLQFEQDDLGNKIVIDPNRIGESLQGKFDIEGQRYLEQNMLNILRNPK